MVDIRLEPLMASNIQSPSNADYIGPKISHNVTKVLEECVRAMVEQLPPSSVQKSKGRVKRPMNAFMVYSQTARKAMAKVYPKLSYRKLSKALGKNWGVMGLDEKKPFMREAERLRQKHKEEHPDYKFKPSKTRPNNCTKQYPSRRTVKTTPNNEKSVTKIFHSPSVDTFEKLPSEPGDIETMSMQRAYFGSNQFELSAEGNNFRSHDKLMDDECVPLLSYLNNSQQQREVSIPQIESYPGDQAYKDPSHVQECRGVSHFSPCLADLLPEVDCGPVLSPAAYASELNGSFPSDLVNFCNFITTEKQGFRAVHTGFQNDFMF